MSSFSQFSKRMGKIATDVEVNADKTARKTVLAVDQAVVLSTPVDKGRARSNWVAELDVPFEGELEPYVAGEALGLGEAGNASAALAQAAAVASAYNGNINSEVHITNNLPYIQVLNDGSSDQAPANFVEEAVIEGTRAVKDAKLLED